MLLGASVHRIDDGERLGWVAAHEYSAHGWRLLVIDEDGRLADYGVRDVLVLPAMPAPAPPAPELPRVDWQPAAPPPAPTEEG